MHGIRRPAVSGLAVALGTLLGLAVIGDASTESALLGAATAFTVMFVLTLAYDR